MPLLLKYFTTLIYNQYKYMICTQCITQSHKHPTLVLFDYHILFNTTEYCLWSLFTLLLFFVWFYIFLFYFPTHNGKAHDMISGNTTFPINTNQNTAELYCRFVVFSYFTAKYKGFSEAQVTIKYKWKN